MTNYVENQLSALNIQSATITVKISDFEGNSTKHFNIDDLDAIKALQSFLELRAIEIRNNGENPYKEWMVDCDSCGVFTHIQKKEPSICPKCFGGDIETSNNEGEKVS
jgi:predicted Zn-ribbon and HTH transcriptional regulator